MDSRGLLNDGRGGTLNGALDPVHLLDEKEDGEADDQKLTMSLINWP